MTRQEKVNVRFTTREREALEQFAVDDDRKVSGLIHAIVVAWLRDQDGSVLDGDEDAA